MKDNLIILGEVQAHLIQQRYQTGIRNTMQIKQNLDHPGYNDLIRKADRIDFKKIDRLNMAVQEIKRLHALGLSDSDIAKLVQKAKWNDKRLGYDKLLDKIEILAREKGLDEFDIDNLVQADDIKREMYLHKVQLIAQAEIKNTYNHLQEGIFTKTAD